MNTQPATARAASIPAPTEPPESASAPSVSPRIDDVLGAEDEQEREPDADRGDDLGRDPRLDHAPEDVDAERADDRADDDEDHPGRPRSRWASARCPTSVSAHGAPR